VAIAALLTLVVISNIQTETYTQKHNIISHIMGRSHQILSIVVSQRTRNNQKMSCESRRLSSRMSPTVKHEGRRIRWLFVVVVVALAATAITIMSIHASFLSKNHVQMARITNTMDKTLTENEHSEYGGFESMPSELKQVVEILSRIGIDSLCQTDFRTKISECQTSTSNFDTKIRHLETSSSSAKQCGDESIPWGLSSTQWDVINIVGSLFCVFAVALMSSMFLGFMTLDPLDLRIKIRASVDSEEREYATKLLPLVEDHHRLLVTLLLTDAVFYETMPLFLDNLFPSWLAVLLSVTVLLVVGEIIPSAIFTGPEQLRLASRLTPLMSFFLQALYPVAAPLIWLLNSLVPPEDPEEEAYNRGELSALVRIQYEEREEAKRAVNFTGLVPSTGRALGRQSHPKSIPAVGPMKTPGNVLTVTDKSRGWRNLKREIMEAVEQRHFESHHHFHSTNSSTSSPVYSHYHDRSHRRNRSVSIGSDHDSAHSLSTGPAYEQFAPPLHQAEVKMVEGALTMKTKVGLT
jgi:hypothetical protein